MSLAFGREKRLERIPLRVATGPEDIATVRTLFEEYQRGLGVDLCFQGFAAELAGLPGDYAPPRGGLWLAGEAGGEIGCVALRPLAGTDPALRALAEVKRLYVRPAIRGRGCGLALMRALIAEARRIGYDELRLDTLRQMDAAHELYGRLGFREIAPYYDNPLTGVRYMALDLGSGRDDVL